MVVLPHRADRHAVDADDGELGSIDDGRRCDAAEIAEAGDGDGGAAQLFPPRAAVPRGLARRGISAAKSQGSSASAWKSTGTIRPDGVCVAMPR